MSVTCVQLDVLHRDPEGNRRRVERLLDGVRAELVLLPERFTTGYVFDDRSALWGLAEEADGPACE